MPLKRHFNYCQKQSHSVPAGVYICSFQAKTRQNITIIQLLLLIYLYYIQALNFRLYLTIYRVKVCVSYILNCIALYILAANKHFQALNFRKAANLLCIVEGYKAPTLPIPYPLVSWYCILALQAISCIKQYMTVIDRCLQIYRLMMTAARPRLVEGYKTPIFLIPYFPVSWHRILFLGYTLY